MESQLKSSSCHIKQTKEKQIIKSLTQPAEQVGQAVDTEGKDAVYLDDVLFENGPDNKKDPVHSEHAASSHVTI